MATKTTTAVTHYHVQKKRRADFLEEWRKYRNTVVRVGDVDVCVHNRNDGAGALADLPPGTPVPDLRSLPAFGIQLNGKGTQLRFGANVWNAGRDSVQTTGAGAFEQSAKFAAQAFTEHPQELRLGFHRDLDSIDQKVVRLFAHSLMGGLLGFQGTVLVKEGDAINAEDPLLTLESDKATMDVPSPLSGVVRDVPVKVGDQVVHAFSDEDKARLSAAFDAMVKSPGPVE